MLHVGDEVRVLSFEDEEADEPMPSDVVVGKTGTVVTEDTPGETYEVAVRTEENVTVYLVFYEHELEKL
jgi:ribosomal protein L21E